MRENKEDIYTSYSGSAPQPLQDSPERKWENRTADASAFTQTQPSSPFAQQNFSGQQSFTQQQPPYTQGGYSNLSYPPQGNYGQPQYPPNTPPMYYGQPQYPVQPYAPGQPPKKKNTGKTVAIVIACVVALNLLLFGITLAASFLQSPDKKIEAYEQSGNLADLIAACDLYDNSINYLDNPVTAEHYFSIALADAKVFYRTFPNTECADYYNSNYAAYNQLMADWLYLLLKTEQYDKYVTVFRDKMLEYSPSGDYYMDSYAFSGFVKDGVFELTEEQKHVALRGFDALIEASEDGEERRMNLKEYYDFCEALGMYDRADEIEQQLQEDTTRTLPSVA